MHHKFRVLGLFTTGLLFPVVIYAVNDIGELFSLILTLFNTVVIIVISIGLIAFIWGVLKYIGSGENQEAHKEGKEFMIWGIIALFVMISIWGLVEVIQKTFDITGTSSNVTTTIIEQ